MSLACVLQSLEGKGLSMGYFIWVLGLSLVVAVPLQAEEGHGDGSDYESSDSFSSSGDIIEFNGQTVTGPGSGMGSMEGEVPSEVRNWFEEYALQKTLSEKRDQKISSDDRLTPVFIVEKKTFRNVTTLADTAPSKTGNQTGSMGPSGGLVGANPPSASAVITQNITPNVIINSATNNFTAPQTEEALGTNGEDKSRRTVGRFSKLRWSEKQASDNRIQSESNLGSSFSERLQRKISFWFGGGDASKERSLARRFMVTTHNGETQVEEVGVPSRTVTADTSLSFASSDSWFGWVGWAVAFCLLCGLGYRMREDFRRE